jgi:hypothetical protein
MNYQLFKKGLGPRRYMKTECNMQILNTGTVSRTSYISLTFFGCIALTLLRRISLTLLGCMSLTVLSSVSLVFLTCILDAVRLKLEV